MDKKVLLLLLPPIPSPHAAQHRAQLLYHSVWTRDPRWLHPGSPPPLPGHPSRQEVASKRAGRSQPLLHGLCPTKLQRSPAEPPGAAAFPLAPPVAASASNPSGCQEQDFSIPMRSDRSVSPHLGFALSCSGPVGSQLCSLNPLPCKGRPLSS